MSGTRVPGPDGVLADPIPEDLIDAESQVRSYSRNWPVIFEPVIFESASGSFMHTASGRAYLDFFSGAGALNYGHNNPALKSALIAYLEKDGIMHGLDMMTTSRAEFIREFRDTVLAPRGLDYRIQFTGPTGTNAVEAALKLARKVTGRSTVAAFTNAFHGVSLGALAVTASAQKRAAAGGPLTHTLRLPYDGFGAHGVSGLDLLADLLTAGGGIEPPARPGLGIGRRGRGMIWGLSSEQEPDHGLGILADAVAAVATV
ncbi:MAG TPA: aminotransferase class III-fold pyridoxal phosphate-dependent enzyme [Actinocrinis sp.]|nr:aminotransferase class III-fold pyridoxal phosphate-dependent enzyme [Actinocrinis sp.]HEV2343299.1 aminotransferase class III-fold pyridoxal phosphate-dependent enzyme [Actinocrinis sp.]